MLKYAAASVAFAAVALGSAMQEANDLLGDKQSTVDLTTYTFVVLENLLSSGFRVLVRSIVRPFTALPVFLRFV